MFALSSWASRLYGLTGAVCALLFTVAGFTDVPEPVLVRISNRTEGALAQMPVYLTVTARDAAGRSLRMDRQGRFHPCLPEDNTIPRNGTTWCSYSFALAPAFSFHLNREPGWVGGRIYLSLRGPLLQRVDPATGALNTPNLDNPQDPNGATSFDWVEFALDANGFHGNTTCVDQFGLPILLEITEGSGATLGPVGLPGRRSDLLAAYRSTLPEPFLGLLDLEGLRITAPGRAAPGPMDSYFDQELAGLWAGFRSKPLVLTPLEGTFTGRLEPGGALVFTRDGDAQEYRLRARPTTREVFRCDGVLAEGSPVEQLLGAHVAALLNRSLLQQPLAWRDATLYYRRAACNHYAAFWHRYGLGAKAYGFPYDDVNEQSTLLFAPDAREVRITFRAD